MTTTNEQATPQAAPPPPPPPTRGNYTFAKISNGEITTGKGDEKTVIDNITGTLTALRVHTGEWNGKTISSLEVDVEDSEGAKTVAQVSLDSKVACGMLGASLLECAEGDYISITASRSKDRTPQGSYITFINVQRYDYNAKHWVEIRPEKKDFSDDPEKLTKKISWSDVHDEVFEQVFAHPAYKDRAKKGEGELTYAHLWEAFNKADKIFPSPNLGPKCQAALLTWCNAMLTSEKGEVVNHLSFEDMEPGDIATLVDDAIPFATVTPKALKQFMTK